MQFHPAPRKAASSSCTIFPLPRTGPSRRCRLQLMTKIRLSRFSRDASVIAPRVSGSSVSPSPRNAQTFASVTRLEAAIFQIAIEPRLVNRHEWAEAHRYRRKFPEVRHQPRMRIGRQPAALPKFAPEVFQLLHGKAAFKKCAGVHAGGSVSLEINRVAFKLVGASAEEMVEADFKQRRGGSIRGNVAANAVVHAIGANHHGQGIPADQALDAALDFLIAGEDRPAFQRKWCSGRECSR